MRTDRPNRKFTSIYRSRQGGKIAVYRDGSVRVYGAWSGGAFLVISRGDAAKSLWEYRKDIIAIRRRF